MRILAEFFGGTRNLIIYLVVINLIGFVAMWSDKRKAQKNLKKFTNILQIITKN